MINRSEWYTSRKKVSLDKSAFYTLLVGASLFIIIFSSLFLVQYFDYNNWMSIVNRNKNIFNNNSRNGHNIVKAIYLIRFWGNILTIFLFQITCFIYYKKAKTGYGFFLIWSAVFVGLLIINIKIINNSSLISIFLIVPIVLLLLSLLLNFYTLFKYRRRMQIKYLNLVRKGEL